MLKLLFKRSIFMFIAFGTELTLNQVSIFSKNENILKAKEKMKKTSYEGENSNINLTRDANLKKFCKRKSIPYDFIVANSHDNIIRRCP